MITLPIQYRKQVLNYSTFTVSYCNVEFLEDFGPWNAGELINQLDLNLLSGYTTDGKNSMLLQVEIINAN